VADVFVRHRNSGVTFRAYDGNECTTHANYGATYPEISQDGQEIVFSSGSPLLGGGGYSFCSLMQEWTNRGAFVTRSWTSTPITTPVSMRDPSLGTECVLEGQYPTISNEDTNGERVKAWHSGTPGEASGDDDGYINVLRLLDSL
jgi:hypothetical protein